MRAVNIGKGLFERKVVTVGSISDFLEESPTKRLRINKKHVLAGAGTAIFNQAAIPFIPQMKPLAIPVMSGQPALGAAGLSNTIAHAFDPIIQVIQGLGYPIGFIMISAGALVWLAGNRPKGIAIMKSAAIGYLILQLAPGIMAILVEVGTAMTK